MSKYFSEDHEWIVMDDDVATLGITAFAAEQLGDIVFIELKETGDSFDKDDEIGVIESVKAASEICAPLSGEIIAANDALTDEPSMANQDPEGEGWLYKIKVSDMGQLDDLMDLTAYQALIA